MTKRTAKAKSLARSKQSVAGVAPVGLSIIVAKFLGASFPSVSSFVVGLGVLGKHFKRFYIDNRKLRIEKFSESLRSGLTEIDKTALLKLNDEEIYDVFVYLLEDEETEKAGYYAKLLRYLAKFGTNLDKDSRSALVKKLRQLDMIDLGILGEIRDLIKVDNSEPTAEINSDYWIQIRKKYKDDPFRSGSLYKLESMKIIPTNSYVVDNQYVELGLLVNVFVEILNS